MSVRRLVVDADLAALNVSAFCEMHRLSRWSFYEIRRRYEAEGEAGLEPRSRAPKKVANKTAIEVEDLIIEHRKRLADDGLDAGAETIRWHLQRRWDRQDSVPSAATIWRILKQRGFIVDDPSKAPHKGHRSFQADRANEVCQIDGTDYQLADGGDLVKIINTIDDGSRYVPASQAHPSESFDAVWSTLCAAAQDRGLPQRILADNGKANIKLKEPLAALGVAIGHSRPYHPQTCGKVERFHQTQAKWLAARAPAQTIDELQELLEQFRHCYNHERPHRAIGRQTPAARWDEMAKSGPADRPLQLHNTTTHHTKVERNGIVSARSYSISVGNKHAGQMAWTIITGRHATVFINGHHIRTLTIDPTRRVQPIHPRRGRPTTNNTP